MMHSPEHKITNHIDIEYHTEAQCATWKKCLKQWVPNDEDRQYLQKLAGYCMIGNNKMQSMYFLVGRSRSGRTTFLTHIERILGTYANRLPRDTFMQSRKGAIKTELPLFSEHTLLIAPELAEEDIIDIPLIKELTGEPAISSRFFYQEAKRRKTRAKVIVPTNELPTIMKPTPSIMRRLKVLRFPNQIAIEEIDKDLGSELEAESEGILVWAVQGAQQYLKEGLEDTERMKKENLAWLIRCDPLMGFVSARLVKDTKACGVPSEFLEALHEWGKVNENDALRSMTQKAMNKALALQEVESELVGNVYRYVGWKIRDN